MSNYLKFTEIDGSVYVGDNSTNYPNAIIGTNNIPPKLVIPYSNDNKKVEYIGQYAFFNFSKIYEVDIKARLVAIHRFAFQGCTNLQSINIPSTCEFLGQSCFDGRMENTTIRANGPVSFYFEKYSALSVMLHATFYNYKIATFYIFDNLENVTCIGGNFGNFDKFTIFSPFSFQICGIQTTLIRQMKSCQQPIASPIIKISSMLIAIFIH